MSALSKENLSDSVVSTDSNEKFSSNSSDLHLAEHRNGVSDLLPAQEENDISGDKGSNNDTPVQGNGENSAVLDENSENIGDGKVAGVGDRVAYVYDANDYN